MINNCKSKIKKINIFKIQKMNNLQKNNKILIKRKNKLFIINKNNNQKNNLFYNKINFKYLKL